MALYFYVLNGLVINSDAPPSRWLGPVHAEQSTFKQKPGICSSFLIRHKVRASKEHFLWLRSML